MVSSAPMIELRRLHRFFGMTRAVHDVSFEVGAGHVFGYIGPNGAGKTTSMRILATLDLPTAGDALIDGFSVITDPDRVRRRLGFMPDYFGTYPDINCFEYLDFFARSYGLMGPERRRAIRHVMGFTGLDVLAEKPINGLSKGMKQRLCLGRAMIHDPAVMVLDEPAAGLDPRARIELRQMIRALAAMGKTVLISSHILTELAEMCDSVAIIEHGTLLAVGTVEEIQREHLQRSVVRLRVLERIPEMVAWLKGREHIGEIRVDNELVFMEYEGGKQERAVLLRDIVQAGYAVAEFGGHDKSLEDVFMNVTRGRVQ